MPKRCEKQRARFLAVTRKPHSEAGRHLVVDAVVVHLEELLVLEAGVVDNSGVAEHDNRRRDQLRQGGVGLVVRDQDVGVGDCVEELAAEVGVGLDDLGGRRPVCSACRRSRWAVEPVVVVLEAHERWGFATAEVRIVVGHDATLGKNLAAAGLRLASEPERSGRLGWLGAAAGVVAIEDATSVDPDLSIPHSYGWPKAASHFTITGCRLVEKCLEPKWLRIGPHLHANVCRIDNIA